jgi:hypothetical protein
VGRLAVTSADTEWAVEQLRRRGQIEYRVAGLTMPAAAWCAAVQAAAMRVGVTVVTQVVPPESDVGVAPDPQLVIAVLVDSTLVDECDQAANRAE